MSEKDSLAEMLFDHPVAEDKESGHLSPMIRTVMELIMVGCIVGECPDVKDCKTRKWVNAMLTVDENLEFIEKKPELGFEVMIELSILDNASGTPDFHDLMQA